MSTDMLKSSPLKSIIKFAIPILIGCLFQQLYSMVDIIIVGQTLSNEALAGVGATTSMSFLAIGFIQGMTAGFAVVTSQRFGAGDIDGVKKSVAISFVLSTIFCVILTIASTLTTMPLLRLMQTPNDIIGHSYDYMIVMYSGLFSTVLYNIGASIMRAVGDSRTPLIFLIIASLLNVCLDFLFIMVFKMGVKGAGIATVISQGFSGFACIIYMFVRFPILRLKLDNFKVSLRFALKHIAVAMPMALQFSIIAIGIMVQQSALNGFGSEIIAAYTAANRIDQFAVQILLSIGMALAVYCGQNFGAGNIKRIWTGVNKTAILSVFVSIVVGVLIVALAKPLTRLFMADITENILNYSQKFLFYQGVFYTMLAGIFVYRNALQGMGYSIFTFIACIIELGMRVIASLLLTQILGFTGICLSNPVAWIAATLMLCVVYYIIIAKKLKQQQLELTITITDEVTSTSSCDVAA